MRDVDLEELFPNNEHIEDMQRVPRLCLSKLGLFFLISLLCLMFNIQCSTFSNFGGIFIGSICHFGISNIDIYFFVIRIYLKVLLLGRETFCFIVFFCFFFCIFLLDNVIS